LYSEVVGEIETEDKVLVVRRIRVTYYLKLDEQMRSPAERAYDIHADYCPVARTIRDCVEITTRLELEFLTPD
jgi:uncharacterized OsmC-like protein